LGTQAEYVGVLQSFVGITEAPDGSNLTLIGGEFGWNGVPWCCETVSVALKRAATPVLWTASVLDARERAKRGEKGCDGSRLPVPRRRGMRSSSTGRASRSRSPRQLPHRDHLGGRATEHVPHHRGNYRDQVAWVWRDLNFVQGFIRFPFDAPVPPIPQEVDLSWPSFVDPKNGNKVLAKPTASSSTMTPREAGGTSGSATSTSSRLARAETTGRV